MVVLTAGLNADDVTIGAGSTLGNSGNNAISVGGSWTNAGTFTSGNSTVTFDAADTGHTITSDGDSFYSLVFNGAGGAWTLQDAVTATSI